MLTKTEVTEAVKEAMKPTAPVTDQQKFMAWMLAKYPGLKAEAFEQFTDNAKATLYSEYENAQKAAAPAGPPKLPPMPGAVAADTASRQLAWANLMTMRVAGQCSDADLQRNGFPGLAD